MPTDPTLHPATAAPPVTEDELRALPDGAEITRYDGSGRVHRFRKLGPDEGPFGALTVDGPVGVERLMLFAPVPVLLTPRRPLDFDGAVGLAKGLGEAAGAEDHRHPSALAAWWSTMVYRPLDVADAAAVLGWIGAKAAFRQAYNDTITAGR